jgi:hypothetical protein
MLFPARFRSARMRVYMRQGFPTQAAQINTNPQTLLNYLNERISRSERLNLWSNAKCNIIDVADAVSIAQQLIANNSA